MQGVAFVLRDKGLSRLSVKGRRERRKPQLFFFFFLSSTALKTKLTDTTFLHIHQLQ